MENTHDDPYDRALHDPGFLEAVRAQHRGRWDVLDALWWTTHPTDPAPSGRPAPLVRLEALQKRVFAADADAAGDPAVSRDLRALQTELVRERTLIDAAIVAAHIGEGRARAKARVPDADDGPVYSVSPVSPGPGPVPVLVPVPRPAVVAAARAAVTRRVPGGARLRLVGGFAIVLLLGVVIGGQLAEATSGAAGPPPPTSSAAAGATPRATPRATAGIATVPALEIFERTQIGTDTPHVPLPTSFDPSSLRAMSSVAWDPTGPRLESPFYAARADGDRVCLLLMIDDTHHLSTCVGADEFARDGVRLYWTSDLGFYTEFTTLEPGPQNLYLEWMPSGMYGVGTASDTPS